MAVTFYKLKEGNKLWKIDIQRDENNVMTGYICRNLEMARDASIENYRVRFICYDRTLNKNTMFVYDVGYNDCKYREYLKDENENDILKSYLTTSKKTADIFCKDLDKELGITDGKETGQDD